MRDDEKGSDIPIQRSNYLDRQGGSSFFRFHKQVIIRQVLRAERALKACLFSFDTKARLLGRQSSQWKS